MEELEIVETLQSAATVKTAVEESEVQQLFDAYIQELAKGEWSQKVKEWIKTHPGKGIKDAVSALKGKKTLSSEDFEQLTDEELIENIRASLETLKKKNGYPMPQMMSNLNADAVEILSKTLGMLKKAPEEPDKKYPYPYPEKQEAKEFAKEMMNQVMQKDETIQKLSKKTEELGKRLEELENRGIKKAKEELSQGSKPGVNYIHGKKGEISSWD